MIKITSRQTVLLPANLIDRYLITATNDWTLFSIEFCKKKRI